MDLVTPVGAMLIRRCAALDLPHLLAGIWQRLGSAFVFDVAVAVEIRNRSLQNVDDAAPALAARLFENVEIGQI
jgi:hypothetical protein